MGATMNNNWVHTVKLALAVVFIVTTGGCASLNPDNFVPASIVSVGNDQRFAGSVNVQANVPEISEGKSGLFENGTAPVMREALPIEQRGKVKLFQGDKLKTALEKAIEQNGLFPRIEAGAADYVLDVWLVNAIREIKAFGEGYIIDVNAIWRLTRTGDGKVLMCSFVNGHGASHAFGSNAYVQSLETALRDMVHNGLAKLADRSSEHLDAKSAAGNRPSMGPAVPEGFTQWSASVRQNWSKLRIGLPLTEVEAAIGPVMMSGAITKSFTRGYTQELETAIYTLVFINGKLSRWELR
jgi:hypothetical protein